METDDQQVIKRLEAQVAEQTAQLQRSSDEREKAIAAQRQTEEALRESESKYLLLTENASDVVWRLDSEYRFTYISPADERLRGYRADEIIGRHVFEMFNEEGVAAIQKMAQQRYEAEQRGIQSGITAITADTDKATREACYAAGINAVLPKPVIPEQLAQAIAMQAEGVNNMSFPQMFQLTAQALTGLSNNPERIRNFADDLKSLQEKTV